MGEDKLEANSDLQSLNYCHSSLESRKAVPGVLSTQVGNNGLRVLRGCQHEDLAIRKEAEVPMTTKSTVNAKVTMKQ